MIMYVIVQMRTNELSEEHLQLSDEASEYIVYCQ